MERQGIAVVRNASYSGDGGLGGEFVYKGCRYLVQAKRYVGTINAAHVQTFGALIAARSAALRRAGLELRISASHSLRPKTISTSP